MKSILKEKVASKERIYNNIMNKSYRINFSLKKAISMVAIIIAIIIFSVGTVYAASKIFNWDKEFLNFFGISSEDAEKINLKNNEVDLSVKVDNVDINIKEITVIEDKMYLLMDYKFDTKTDWLEVGSYPFEKMCFVSITKDGMEELFGNLDIIYVNDDKTAAVVVGKIYSEDKIKNNDKIKFNFETSYYFTADNPSDPLSGGTGSCNDRTSLEWTVDIDMNTDKIAYEFDKDIYLKDTNELKILPKKVTINPIEIRLELNLYFDGDSLNYSNFDSKFDKTVDIIFKDGKAINLSNEYDDTTLVKGSNIIGEDTDKDGNKIRVMVLTYDNTFTVNNYSKYDFKLLDVKNISKIKVGDFEASIK